MPYDYAKFAICFVLSFVAIYVTLLALCVYLLSRMG